jgi:hypothetical protein
MGFLCVTLGSSTIQFHDSVGNRWTCAYSVACFSSKNGERAWGEYYRRATFCCAFFLWARGLNTKEIRKQMFPIIVGSVYRVKRFTTDSRNWTLVAHASLTTKMFYAAGFDALVKRWDKCVNVEGAYVCREINVYSRIEYLMFYALYPFGLYLLALSRMCEWCRVYECQSRW